VLDELNEELGVGRLLHRLRREPDMLANKLGWPARYVGNLVRQPADVLVKAPHQGWQPGKATLYQHDAQL
jgi:hypothetical protein